MTVSPPVSSALARGDAAPQHGPRPLPLFLSILWRETEGDARLRKRAFQGLRKYQEADRPDPPPAATWVAQAGPARLLRYGRDEVGTRPDGPPVVFIPSLINPPRILDVSESRSLLRHMAATGHDAHLVDWGEPAADDAEMDLAKHVTERLLPLISALPRPPILIGYCLGGTL
ncbi:MAG: alpha/beta hydrolase, partial [Sphingobium sp.]